MVLALKRWKSRSPPGIVAGAFREKPIHFVIGLKRRWPQCGLGYPLRHRRYGRPVGLAKLKASGQLIAQVTQVTRGGAVR